MTAAVVPTTLVREATSYIVCCASTAALVGTQESRPKPFSITAAPFLPTTTAAPGYPPALMPRATTRSIASRRVEDMPTSVGGLTGSPSPARVTVSAVRMTLSNANSLDYRYLYRPQKKRFPPPGRGKGGSCGMARAYSCRRLQEPKSHWFCSRKLYPGRG